VHFTSPIRFASFALILMHRLTKYLCNTQRPIAHFGCGASMDAV